MTLSSKTLPTLSLIFSTLCSLLDCYVLLTKTNRSSRSSPLPWITPDILNLKSPRRHLERIYINTHSISDWKIPRTPPTDITNHSCRQAFVLLLAHPLFLLKSLHSLEYHKQHPSQNCRRLSTLFLSSFTTNVRKIFCG